MATATTTSDRQRARGRLDWCLGLFGDVRAGEAWRAFLLAADIFFLLGSYYLLKTARESLILSEGGAEVKSYASAAQALILLIAVPLYGRVASRVPRLWLINGVTLFFVSHLAAFHLLAGRGLHVGVAFFLWVGVFNLMIVAQFWSFANDIYTVERGQRLFPIIGVGGSLGAWLGARAAAHAMAAHLRPADLFTLAAGGLLICTALNYGVGLRRPAGAQRSPEAGDEPPLEKTSAFRIVLTDRYLRLMALLIVLVNVVNTIGEYLLGRLVVAQAARAVASGTAHGLSKSQLIGVFYGDFFGWVNLAALALQLIVVSRVFTRIGIGRALLVLPAVALGGYALLAIVPLLGAVRVEKILENSLDYSLQNTARHALFLPTSREAKYKAKQAIDALCWRLGDLLQAGVVFAGVSLAFGVRQFAALNALLVIVWLVVALRIGREHARRAVVAEPLRDAA